MSTYSEVGPPARNACHVFTASEHEELGLNPNIDLPLQPFPPLSDAQDATTSSPIATTPLLHYQRLVLLHPVPLGRYICDLHTPSYDPAPLWSSENGEIPNPVDPKMYNADYLHMLASCFPLYRGLIAAANPYDPLSVKKVSNLILRYVKEEREKLWGSMAVIPQLTWQDPAESYVQESNTLDEKGDSDTCSQPQDEDDAAAEKPKPKPKRGRKRKYRRTSKISKKARRAQKE